VASTADFLRFEVANAGQLLQGATIPSQEDLKEEPEGKKIPFTPDRAEYSSTVGLNVEIE
jgi:hypothetical protein